MAYGQGQQGNALAQPQNSPPQRGNALAGMQAPEQRKNALTFAYNGLDPELFQMKGFS